MSEQAPQLAAPAPEQIPGQEQLFNDTAYDEQVIAERQAQAEAALASAVAVTPDERVHLTKPVSKEEAQAARDALILIDVRDEELPDAVRIKRDYSDNLAEHKEKQAAKQEEVADVLIERIVAHAKSEKIKAANAADNKVISDKLSSDMSRKAKTAEVIENRAADVAKRQELREAYIAKQRLLRGEGQSKLFADEISREADKYVKSVMHPGAELSNDGVVDTQKLKDEKYGKAPANVVKNEETAEALKNFYKGFPEVNPEATKANASEADKGPKIVTNPAEAKEALEDEPGMRIFSYKPNAEGMVDMAVSFEVEGVGVDLAELTDLDDKNIIFATEEDEDYAPLTFYVADGEVYNLTHMDLYKNDKGGWSVSDMAGKSSITIGEPVMVDGKQVSGPVKRIMLEMPPEHKDQLEESWEAQDKQSPFRVAEDLIDSIENAAEVTVTPIEVDDYVLMKDRPKKIMGWAAKQLKRLKNAPLAAGTYVSNKLHNTSERFSKQEKGRRRSIIGATAGAILLAGAAYLDLKGHGTGNTQELVNGPKGTMPNPLEGVNLASATDKHQAIREIADITPRGGHGAAVVDHVKTVTVHGNSGDTLWNEATQKLHRQGIVNPTNNQINVGTLRLEHLNGISPEQAHFLANEGDEVIKV